MNDIIEALDVRDLLCLVDEICKRRGVTRLQVCGRARTQAVARARHELWWRLRHDLHAHFSYEEIGRLFGRHHVTVLHGVRAHDRRLAAPGPSAAGADAERARLAEAERTR
jgi:chromosomal replication initiation ATPase DnaA